MEGQFVGKISFQKSLEALETFENKAGKPVVKTAVCIILSYLMFANVMLKQ